VRILSYCGERNGKYVEETLDEHVREMAQLLKNVEMSPAGRYGSKLLAELGYGDVGFKDVLLLAVLTHDFGKAFYSSRGGKCSFRGHELISVLILQKAKNYMRPMPVFALAMDFAGFAVLYHHHAMGIKSKYTLSVSVEPAKALGNLEGMLTVAREIGVREEWIGALAQALAKLKELSTKRMEADAVMNASEMGAHYWKIMAGGNREKRLMFLTLASLIAVDNVAASRLREGHEGAEEREKSKASKGWVFGEVSAEFYETYLPSSRWCGLEARSGGSLD